MWRSEVKHSQTSEDVVVEVTPLVMADHAPGDELSPPLCFRHVSAGASTAESDELQLLSAGGVSACPLLNQQKHSSSSSSLSSETWIRRGKISQEQTLNGHTLHTQACVFMFVHTCTHVHVCLHVCISF